MKILEDGGHRFNNGNCMIIAFVGEAIKAGEENKPKSISTVANNNMFTGQNGHESDFSQVLTTW